MAHIDNLVEPGLETIALTAVPTLLRSHRESFPSPLRRHRITPRRPTQFASLLPTRPANPAKTILPNPRRRPKPAGLTVLHGRPNSLLAIIAHFRRKVRSKCAGSVSIQLAMPNDL